MAEYPYIDLDLLRDYAVCFYGKVVEYRPAMRNAVKNYDGLLHCDMNWWCGDDTKYYISKNNRMLCTNDEFIDGYQVISIEELIEMSNGSNPEQSFEEDLMKILGGQ